jgi:Uma2 family endonuclease
MAMNLRVPVPVRETRAAEGLPRRAFTVAEVERMLACGILQEDERLELIGGELVPMPAKGIRPEGLKEAPLRHRLGNGPDGLHIVPETTFRLSLDTFLEPDLVVYRAPVRLPDISGPNILLAVEIADSSLGYDLHRKPAIYAGFGVRELWVIDAVRRVVHLHCQPGDGGYGRVLVAPAETTVVPDLVPDLPLTLAALELDWDE